MNNSSSEGGAGMGGPGVPYSPPYVLVPASALQFCASSAPVRIVSECAMFCSVETRRVVSDEDVALPVAITNVLVAMTSSTFISGCCMRRLSLVRMISADLGSTKPGQAK